MIDDKVAQYTKHLHHNGIDTFSNKFQGKWYKLFAAKRDLMAIYKKKLTDRFTLRGILSIRNTENMKITNKNIFVLIKFTSPYKSFRSKAKKITIVVALKS